MAARLVTRGEIYRLAPRRHTRGREHASARYAVVVQADELLPFSTVLVAPTSTSSVAATFRPVIEMSGMTTRVLVEQIYAVDLDRLDRPAGRLNAQELARLDDALALVLGL